MFIWGPVKIEKELSAFTIQWWDRHRTDNPIPEGDVER